MKIKPFVSIGEFNRLTGKRFTEKDLKKMRIRVVQTQSNHQVRIPVYSGKAMRMVGGKK